MTVQVKGLVQGVGYRPFVYRMAMQHHLTGWVVNRTDGVMIRVEGIASHMAGFMEDLRNLAPVVAQVDEVIIDQDLPEGLTGFSILASQDLGDETSEICPDIAVCPDCLADILNQPHRLHYPFVNCTNCGPRFSIIRSFPYDRVNTAMSVFKMCEQCQAEYDDINDRRFHAQPVACNSCGPVYTLHIGKHCTDNLQEVIEQSAAVINNGGLLAIKGLGGFHLMCDATNDAAVSNMRQLKQREGKPFAVMFRDLESLKIYGEAGEAEVSSLTSWRRPVVIIGNKNKLAHGVTLGLNTLGAFLPYMPIHYLLFGHINTPAIVLTSGNIADEPVIISNNLAMSTFSELTNGVITYNRDIVNRSDDSVVRIILDKERILRRSRGYVPQPLRLSYDVNGILAVGAELSGCFCIGKENRAYLSQHIGDLKNHETFQFFEESVSRFQQLFRIKPIKIAADLHPDYLSTRYATSLGLPVVYVQHHHAHIASCMAENNVDEQVIGLAFDGTGYGTDGHTWGSEFLVCDYSVFTRYSHFAYMPLPGGDLVTHEPWRMGLALLYQAFGVDLMQLRLPLLEYAGRKKCSLLIEAMEKDINCPLSCGAGRLFDAVASITGLCHAARFHAEAPMRLESAIIPDITDSYDTEISDVISFIPAIRQMVKDMEGNTDVGIIATRFHNALCNASLQVAQRIRKSTGITSVALSGGIFQNKYISEKLEMLLVNDNFTVYTHSHVPCNDGGIALGQLAIAGSKISK
ncbi:MAG: carbamoyltransferase HypF [Bacteroidales bacterium]|nr:carbamoyltransferase HypF [Bacteroidales bacterium]